VKASYDERAVGLQFGDSHNYDVDPILRFTRADLGDFIMEGGNEFRSSEDVAEHVENVGDGVCSGCHDN